MSRWAMAWTTVISSDEVPDMMELMLWVILVLVMVSAALNMAMYSRMARKSMELRADDEVQKALDAALLEKMLEEGHDDGQVQKTEEVRDRDMSRAMDEGFDSIMRYTVNLGRGRTTGGEP